MKKLFSLSIASLALAAAADPFSPSIGVEIFPSTGTSTSDTFLLPVKFDSLSASAISPKELVATNGLTVGSTWLYIFQNNAYTSWCLEPTGWTAAANAGDAELLPTPPDPAQTLAAGSAIWIKGVEGKSIAIYGKVRASQSSTIVRGKTNLLANPTGSPVTGTALATKLSGVAQAKDKLVPIGGSFAGNYIYNGSKWVHVVGTTINEDDPLPDLAAYQGFWYVASGTGDPGTINW